MKIAIDPGHGMSNRQRGIYDPGAGHYKNGTQFKEAEIVGLLLNLFYFTYILKITRKT